MSNFTKQCEQACDSRQGRGAVELIIEPRAKDLGGFSVRRVLPTTQRKMVGPWIFFDHMGPAQFAAGEGVNVRPHPHIGIATVTYLFEGEILHRDSLGSYQAIRPGDLNLMIAGKGIVHSEREHAEVAAVPHRAHGLQLWLALPKSAEEIDPAFYHYAEADIPHTVVNGVSVRVMMGSAYGITSDVRVFSDTLYLEADLKAGQSLTLPNAEERGVYVVQGQLNIEGISISEYAMAVIADEADVTLTAVEDSRIALVGGEKFDQRFIEWNFVSSSKERIEQAKDDWVCGRFPTVPGDDEEYIPLPQ